MSKAESRAAVGIAGAETLNGQGEMLFLRPPVHIPERIQGLFVSDEEVRNFVQHLRSLAEPNYNLGFIADVQSAGISQVGGEVRFGEPQEDEGGYDELYDKAVAIVTDSRRASISGVQRRLKIDYNRAARLIEIMEAQGIVSAPQYNGNREVLAPSPRDL